MKKNVDYKGYDTLIQPTDWRYSAACLGLHRFLTYSGFDFMLLNDCEDTFNEAIHGFDGILYHSSDLTEENYLLFAETFLSKFKGMPHIEVLKRFNGKEHLTDYEEKDIKTLNKMIKELKLTDNELKFDGENKDVFIKQINDNRLDIIRKCLYTFYQKYCRDIRNKSIFYNGYKTCRINGYWIDEPKKSNSLGFCFDKNSFTFEDVIEFDFIPFAFSNSEMYETYFVNNNYSIKDLVNTNRIMSKRLRDNEKKNPKTRLLSVLQQADDFINYDVEIIVKNRDNDFYNTMFIRAERLRALKQLKDKSLSFTYKIAEDYWLNLEREVYERCLNNVLLDDLIERMLKIILDSEVNKTTVRFRINTLVDINVSWKGSMIMSELENAKKLGYVVSQRLIEKRGKNKISSYQQRIISALVAHDYDRVKEVLLSLSAYSGVEFAFFYKFLEDAEKYKDLAFAFASSLKDPTENKNK